MPIWNTTRTVCLTMLVGALAWTMEAKAQSGFTLAVDKTSAAVEPSGVAEFSITITNSSFGDIEVHMVRTANDLPTSEWLSSLCTGLNCYSSEQSAPPPFTVKAGKEMTCMLSVVAGSERGKTAHVQLQFATTGSDTAETRDFTVTIPDGNAGVGTVQTVARGTAYPNPARSFVLVPLPSTPRAASERLEIFNVQGVRVLDATEALQGALESHAGHVRVDVAVLPPGAYLYRLSSDTHVVAGPVVVVR